MSMCGVCVLYSHYHVVIPSGFNVMGHPMRNPLNNNILNDTFR